jgi:hypothetical protein
MTDRKTIEERKEKNPREEKEVGEGKRTDLIPFRISAAEDLYEDAAATVAPLPAPATAAAAAAAAAAAPGAGAAPLAAAAPGLLAAGEADEEASVSWSSASACGFSAASAAAASAASAPSPVASRPCCCCCCSVLESAVGGGGGGAWRSCPYLRSLTNSSRSVPPPSLTPRIIRLRKTHYHLFLSAFPMFVPSLSW